MKHIHDLFIEKWNLLTIGSAGLVTVSQVGNFIGDNIGLVLGLVGFIFGSVKQIKAIRNENLQRDLLKRQHEEMDKSDGTK